MEPNNINIESPLQPLPISPQPDFSNQTPPSKKVSKIIASVSYLFLLFISTYFLALGGYGYLVGLPYLGILILGIIFALIDLEYEDYFSTFFVYLIFAIIVNFPHNGMFGYTYFQRDIIAFLYYLLGISPFILSNVHKSFKLKSFKPLIIFIGGVFLSIVIFASIGLIFQVIYPSKITGYNNSSIIPTAEQYIQQQKIMILDNCTVFSTPQEISKYYEKTCKLLLQNQNISVIPKEIFTFNNLQMLDLSNNNISQLPQEIGNLSNLISLDLSNNKLTDLPKEILNLKKLDSINLSNNKFSDSEKIKIYGMLLNTNISFYSGEWTTGASFVKYSNACSGGSDVTCKNSQEFSMDTIKTATHDSTVSFQGKISNPNSYRLYYKGGSASVQSDGIDIDYTLIGKIVPNGISAKGNYNGELFQVKIGKDVKPGTYSGLFILTLGKDELNPDISDKEYDINFQVQVSK